MIDRDYNNNEILFISPSKEISVNWAKNNTRFKIDQISIKHYVVSDDNLISETEISIE